MFTVNCSLNSLQIENGDDGYGHHSDGKVDF